MIIFIKDMLKVQLKALEYMKKKKFFFTPAHDALLNTAWKMFLDKPLWVMVQNYLGLNVKRKKYLNYNETCNNHPHNFYMQLLSETGIIGFLFLFWFIYLFYL